jgi:hypothetical protein
LQTYITCPFPSGTWLTFRLLTSHSDLNYIGLNGLQIYDQLHKLVEKEGFELQARPSSVAVIEGM